MIQWKLQHKISKKVAKLLSKNCYIVVSESSLGSHTNVPNLEHFIFYSMTIPLNLLQDKESEEKKYKNNTKLGENAKLLDMASKYAELKKKYDNVYFLIGFDADIQGEYMAYALKEALLLEGVKENDIFRMPFCATHYLVLAEFKDMQNYMDFKGLEREFTEYIKRHNKKNGTKLPYLSLNKVLGMEKIYSYAKNKKQVRVLNNEKTNIFTYIVNHLQKEPLR